MTQPLGEINNKIKVRVVFIEKCPISRTLKEFGFIPGAIVEVLRHAPLEDPVEYSVRGSKISLRRNEANYIHVEVI